MPGRINEKKVKRYHIKKLILSDRIKPVPFPVLPALKKGSYIIALYLKTSKNIQIGKLGTFHFQKGYHAYVGSALGPGGLSARLNHHLKITNKPHWHIDYLRKETIIKEIWVSEQEDRLEHIWAEKLKGQKNASIPVPGFGSSDCRCATHLVYFQKMFEMRKARL